MNIQRSKAFKDTVVNRHCHLCMEGILKLCLPSLLSILRIQLILMWIRIQILDPHWKKMDPDLYPDPVYFFLRVNFFFAVFGCFFAPCIRIWILSTAFKSFNKNLGFKILLKSILCNSSDRDNLTKSSLKVT